MLLKSLLGCCAVFVVLCAGPSARALPATWYGLNSPASNSLTAVVYGPGQWLAVGSNSTVLVCQDGYRWKQVSNRFSAGGDLLSATYGNGLYVVGGTLNNLLCASADGTNWSVQASSVGSQSVDGLAFGAGMFVAVGKSGAAGSVMTSTNGTNWSTATIPLIPPLKAVTYNTYYARGLFVAVGEAGALITSTNGLNWTARASGTTNILSAVTFTFNGYLAAGEDSVFSPDGLSWSLTAPASFVVRALASESDGLVAAGNYDSAGRIQSSSDGTSWPGDAIVSPQALNGLGSGNYSSPFMAVGNAGLILSANSSAGPDANSWTNVTGGYWEQPYWHLGELPAFWNQQVLLTNAGTKTLTIASNTAAAAPYSLQIRGLEISGPGTSQNTLLLNHAGLSTPLNVQGTLCVDTNGSLVSYGSALQAGALIVSNTAVFSDDAQSQFGSVSVNGPASAQLVLSNGYFSASQALTIGTGDSGTAGLPGGGSYTGVFTQYGGSNQVNYLNIAGNGHFTLFDGSLEATNGGIGLQAKSARMDIWGGTVITPQVYISDQYVQGPGAIPEINLLGGAIHSPSLQVWGGAFSQLGGTAVLDTISVTPGSSYMLADGLLLSRDISLGTFSQSGGVHTNTDTIVAGTYQLTGGILDTPAETLNAGTFSQSGTATNHAALLNILASSVFTFQGGLLITSNTVVNGWPNGGRLAQSGGTHQTGTLTMAGGVYDLQAGTFSVTNVQLIGSGQLRLTGGTFASNPAITLENGFLQVAGTRSFGALFLTASGPSGISLLSNTPATLYFPDSHTNPWYNLSHLIISNWNSSLHHVYVGTSANGLTAAQVQQVNFASPAGFPIGLLPARLLPTGELVPTSAPGPRLTKLGGQIKLEWPTGFALYSSSDVNGPYQLVASPSPYTNGTSAGQGFFLLEPFW